MNNDSLFTLSRCRLLRVGCLFALLWAPLACAAQSHALSMENAVSLACAKNPKIIQYQEKLSEKKWDYRGALGNYLPVVSLSSGYTALNGPLVMDLDPIREAMLSLQTATMTKMAADSFMQAHGNALPPAALAAFRQQYGAAAAAQLEAAVPHFIDTLKKQYYPAASVTVVQPIFMGGKIVAGSKAASADRQGALLELDRVHNEVMQETFNDYCSVALLDQVVQVRRTVLDGMTKHREHAEKLFKAGMIARNNVLRAEVAVAEAQRALDDDRNRLALAKLALAKSLNVPEDDSIFVTDTLAPHQLSGTADSYASRADSAQPILAWLKTRQNAARANLIAQRAALLPHVAVFGKYELFPDYLSVLEPHWTVGAALSMDLFAGGKNISHLQSANHLEKETASLVEGARRDIHLWVRKSYLECVNAQDRYTKLMADEALALENLRQCRSRFENGYGAVLDVIDAEMSLEKTRIEKATALYDFNRAYMDLCTASGEPARAVSLYSSSREKP